MKKWILSAITAAFALSACEKENKECPGATEKTYQTLGFTKISAGETFQVNIVHGTGFQIKATGCENDLNDLNVTVAAGGILELKYKNHKKDRYRVDFTITMPRISMVNLSGVAKGNVTGFGEQEEFTWAILSGASELLIDETPEDIQLDLTGTGKLTLKGEVKTLKGVVSEASVLQAFDTPAEEVDISASGTGKAYIQPLHSLIAEAGGASHIIYRGDPPVKDIVTSGAGKVTKE